MPLFLIERQFADLVPTDPETMATVKQVNDEIGIQWLFSFLSADKRKTYCLYEAPSAVAIRAAAERLGHTGGHDCRGGWHRSAGRPGGRGARLAPWASAVQDPVGDRGGIVQRQQRFGRC